MISHSITHLHVIAWLGVYRHNAYARETPRFRIGITSWFMLLLSRMCWMRHCASGCRNLSYRGNSSFRLVNGLPRPAAGMIVTRGAVADGPADVSSDPHLIGWGKGVSPIGILCGRCRVPQMAWIRSRVQTRAALESKQMSDGHDYSHVYKNYLEYCRSPGSW